MEDAFREMAKAALKREASLAYTPAMMGSNGGQIKLNAKDQSKAKQESSSSMCC